MKKFKPTCVVFLLSLSSLFAQGQNPSLVNFATSVFKSIKNNDFNSFMLTLPSPPFTLSLKSLGQGKEDLPVTTGQYNKWRNDYKNQFESIISALTSAGINRTEMLLDKVIIECSNESRFQVVEIFLIMNSTKGKYRIRIEDCINVDGGKYLWPEQLKWEGKEK